MKHILSILLLSIIFITGETVFSQQLPVQLKPPPYQFKTDGLISILKMINLGNRPMRDNLLLETSDVTDIKSFITITERLGCEMPPELKERLFKKFNISIGKTKDEIIQVFKETN